MMYTNAWENIFSQPLCEKASAIKDMLMEESDSGFTSSSNGSLSSSPTAGVLMPAAPTLNLSHHCSGQSNGEYLERHQRDMASKGASLTSEAKFASNLQSGLINVPFGIYPSRSSDFRIQLQLIKEPEVQHRARYLTEGSRGAIKDATGRGFPIVKLSGYTKSPVKLQCFVGHDKKVGEPHLFYQAYEVNGKTPFSSIRVDGINILETVLERDRQMTATIDFVGILKERNVDVERKVLKQRKRNKESYSAEHTSVKTDSTSCRLVFRCILPDTGEILQVASEPICCKQPNRTPEIHKISLAQSTMDGGDDLIIIGKNFQKDAKIIWQAPLWKKVVDPIREFAHSSHLVCHVPRYDAPDASSNLKIDAFVHIECNGKISDGVKFRFINKHFYNASLNAIAPFGQENYFNKML